MVECRKVTVRGAAGAFFGSDLDLYVGLSAEAGRMNGLYTQGGASTGNLYSGSVYLGAETFLGPAYLGVGFAGGGNTAAYFLLGVPW